MKATVWSKYHCPYCRKLNSIQKIKQRIKQYCAIQKIKRKENKPNLLKQRFQSYLEKFKIKHNEMKERQL